MIDGAGVFEDVGDDALLGQIGVIAGSEFFAHHLLQRRLAKYLARDLQAVQQFGKVVRIGQESGVEADLVLRPARGQPHPAPRLRP